MSKRILVIASNLGLWAEELQGPWDELKKAGHKLTLATELGLTPLPLQFSMDPSFFDPQVKQFQNPAEIVERCKQLLTNGEWSSPIKIADANMDDYDAIVIVGGPGAPLDLTGNAKIHRLLEKAYTSDKMMGALCYAVGCFVWARRPEDGKSIIWGKTVTAHPREWDFTGPLPYFLYNATPENPGTNIVTPGFVYPLAPIVEDAVGPDGKVLSDPTTTRQKPQVAYDWPFVTALSLESSKPFGEKLVEVLASR